jgi:3-oxoacyl-[acyl-carrier-protein] synthase III
MQVGIPAIEYVLGSDTVSVEELEARGALDSPAATLSTFGFSCARLSRESPYTLAAAATNKLLCATGVDRASIGALFYAGATPGCHVVETPDPLSAFNYPVSQLQYELELINATAFGVSQVGCLGLMAAVTLAKDFLLSSKTVRRALCVSADVLPAGLLTSLSQIHHHSNDHCHASPNLAPRAIPLAIVPFCWQINERLPYLSARQLRARERPVRATLPGSGAMRVETFSYLE